VTFTFASNQRVRQSSVFEHAFRHKGLTNKWFAIHLKDSNQEFARLGMVVSKKLIAKSVCRNHAKRLIRDLFRLNSSKFPALDFIIRIRRKLPKESSGEARAALLQLMLSAKMS